MKSLTREDITDEELRYLTRCELCGAIVNIVDLGKVSHTFVMCRICRAVEQFRKKR